MNKKLIAVAVAATLALPMIAAQASDMETKGPSVYGKLHLNLGKYDELGTTNDNWRLNSFASRLGFKGQQNLGEGLAGTYKFESEIDVAGDKVSELSTRNTYVGLKGGFGELRVGRHDSPLKMAQGKFDQFGDTEGDLKHVGSQDGENRNTNSITYLGKFGGMGLNAQINPSEGDGTTSGQGIADNSSIALSYTSGPLYLAVAHDSYDKKVGASENGMTSMFATYKVAGMQFGLLSQTGVEKPSASTAKETWLGLSFNTKLGSDNKLKAQYITVKDNATSQLKTTSSTIGLDHKLGKKGTLYAMYNTIKSENSAVTKDNKSVSVGYVLKF